MCGACGQPCSETDRGLVVMHQQCIRQVKEIVAREGRLSLGRDQRRGR
jgi:hypothetical protein